MTAIHYIWALFPSIFFLLFIWSYLRPHFGYRGKEDSGSYFSQGVFCLVALLIAIGIDRLESWEYLLMDISAMTLDVSILRWLLYPLVLVVMANLHKYLFSRGDKRTKPSRNLHTG